MANRVTDLDKIRINELYLEYGTKAAVARELGFSASTVAKYIIPNYNPVKISTEQKKRIEPSLNLEIFNISNWNHLLDLSDEEKEDMEVLRKEISI